MSTGITWVFNVQNDAFFAGQAAIPHTQYIQSFNDYDEASAFCKWSIMAMVDANYNMADDLKWFIYTSGPGQNGYFYLDYPAVEFIAYP